MTVRGAIGAERVVGLVGVVAEVQLPPAVEVLGDEPALGAGPDVDDPVGHAVGALVPDPVARDVAEGEERLDAVHGGVGPAVVLDSRSSRRERLTEHALVGSPTAWPVDDLGDLVEQTRSRRGGPAARAEDAARPTWTWSYVILRPSGCPAR